MPSPRPASRSRPAAALPPSLSRVSPSLCSGVGVREAKILLPSPHHVRSDQRATGAGVGHQEQPRAVGHHLLPLDARYRDRARRSSRSAGTPRPLASSIPAPPSRVPDSWLQCPTLPVPGLVPVPPLLDTRVLFSTLAPSPSATLTFSLNSGLTPQLLSL